ncbi:hypothetical protein N7539_001581 [Penicillium diatomitis]|uniref:Uncharacterized protein n=1 Tax=Penicillium diatomitis TaxID=2819901 RepID=A0A9X0C085_9EURO|nr:uncharacterized protein N7539_001581 [Penicillium diatomitis]KAJ5492835.1 hypothetical protein N7539_001581 [Penicillium diatomitis]
MWSIVDRMAVSPPRPSEQKLLHVTLLTAEVIVNWAQKVLHNLQIIARGCRESHDTETPWWKIRVTAVGTEPASTKFSCKLWSPNMKLNGMVRVVRGIGM